MRAEGRLRAADCYEIPGLPLTFSRLGVGLSVLTGYAGDVNEDDVEAALRAGEALGLRHVDVAPAYGQGRAEELVGRALSIAARRKTVVSTKVGAVLRPPTIPNLVSRTLHAARADDRSLPVALAGVGRRVVTRVARGRPAIDARAGTGKRAVSLVDFRPAAIRESLVSSLERLGTSRLDVVYLHDPERQRWQRIEDAWEELKRHQAAGATVAVGVAGRDADRLAGLVEALRPDCVLIAGRYSLLDQGAASRLFPIARRQRTTVVVGGVFNSGLLADPRPGAPYEYRPAPRWAVERALAIQAVCRKYDVSVREAAVQLPFGHPAVGSVLVGVRSPSEVAGAAAAVDRHIPARLWRDLQNKGLLRREVPVPAS